MAYYSLCKVGSGTFRARLLSILMMTVGSINAVCVSIDKFIAPNGRKIYLFGDVHLGSQELCKQERDAFIAAAKERGAHCIVEDALGYEGDNLLLRQCIDNYNYQNIMSDEDTILKDTRSTLAGLAHECLASGISCFNAEWRQLIDAHRLKTPALQMSILNMMYDNADTMFDKVRTYNDAGIEYKKALSYSIKGLKSSIQYTVDRKEWNNGYSTFIAITKRLFDAHIVHHLHGLLLNQDDRRDIFVFAGAGHIRRIGRSIKKHMGCCSYKIDGYFSLLEKLYPDKKLFDYSNKSLMGARFSLIREKLQKILSEASELNREATRHYIVTIYGADIASYFELDAAVERIVMQEAQLKQEKTRKFIKDTVAKHMVYAHEKAIELA